MIKTFKDGDRLVIIIENMEMSETDIIKKFIASLTEESSEKSAKEIPDAAAVPIETSTDNRNVIAEEMQKVDALLTSIKSMKDETSVLNELQKMAGEAEDGIKKDYIVNAISDYIAVRMKRFDEGYVNDLDEKQAKSFINHYGRFVDEEIMKSITLDKDGVKAIIKYFK